jgi:ribosomal protein L31E
LQPVDKAPQDRRYIDDFIVRSTKVNGSLISEDITEDIFNREEGKLVDEVNLTVTYKAEVPQVESSVAPTEAKSEVSIMT